MNNSPVTQSQVIRVALIIIMLALIYKAGMMFVANVNYDTNYYLNIGINFVEHGELTPYMWRLNDVSNIIAGSGTGYGILLPGYWFKIFGVSLLSGYIFNYIVGILILIASYFLTRMWWNSDVVAWVAVSFLALTVAFTKIFYLRMDALGILAYTIVLIIHKYACDSDRKSLHFLVGMAVIAATEFHMQALLYVASLSVYYLVQQIHIMRRDKKIFQLTPSLYFYAGAFVAGVIYLLIHVAPDPEAYFIIMKGPAITFTAPGPYKEFLRLITAVSLFPIDVTLFFIALAVAAIRRSDADKHIFWLIPGYLLALLVLSPPTQTHYSLHVFPLIVLVVGGVFVPGDGSPVNLSRIQLFASSAAACVMLLFHFFTFAINSAAQQGYYDGIDYVLDYVPEEAVVMSHIDMFHHLIDYTEFISFRDGERYGILLRGEDYLSYWEREHPVVFVGSIHEDEVDWYIYMHRHNFVHVRDDVWVDGDYYNTLTEGVSAPEISLSLSATQVGMGDCVILEWNVLHADEVLLDEEQIDNSGTQEICPLFDHTYTIDAYWIGGIEHATISIDVE